MPPLASTSAAQASTAYPLIILILAVAWVAFVVGAAVWLARFRPPEGWSRKQVFLAAAGTFLVALAMTLALSPGIPVLCTYTGLAD